MKSMYINIRTIGLLALVFTFIHCEREVDFDNLEEAPYPAIGEVFIDDFSSGLDYGAFGGSKLTAFDLDYEDTYMGAASMRFEVPDVGDPGGAYAGGTFLTNPGRDLSGFNVLTFWMKASRSAHVDVLGFGNYFGDNYYETVINNVAVNTNWKQYFIPIADPSFLMAERGMFFYSEGPEDGEGYTFWVDEVQFLDMGTIAHFKGHIEDGLDAIKNANTGDEFNMRTSVSANLPNGTEQFATCRPSYFNFESSNPAVATVDQYGTVRVLDEGEAIITGTLRGATAIGSLTVNSSGEAVRPSTPAKNLDLDAADVISVFSNQYTNINVEFYNGYWQFSTTQSEIIQVQNDDILRYYDLNFVGIQFASPTVNVSEMTHVRMDLWTPEQVAGADFKVLLVDIGPDGTFGGSDDSSYELTFTGSDLKSEEWFSIDVPLSDFPGLNTTNMAQIVLSGSITNIYADNILFYKGENTSGSGPSDAAPNPTANGSDVISIYSDTYTDVAGTDFFPDWGQATQASQIQLNGNNTLLYKGLNYQGIALGSNQDVSGMENLHLDIWTDNSSDLNVYLISPGPVEMAFNINVPTTGWLSLDIPLSEFSSVDLTDVFQLKFDGDGDIYIDNIYFSKAANLTVPDVAADTPTEDPTNVISLFSDAYTDRPVDTWRTDWSAADYEATNVQGNAVQKYANLDFVGIETVANQIDISEMTHVHIDVWSADCTEFGFKLVDFGADGAFGGGDDVEHQLNYPNPALGSWVSYDIPLSEFTGLTTRAHMAQYILVGKPTAATTIYIDNLYFYK